MKGIIFTLDAVFALIIAAASISILLYFAYPTSPYTTKYTVVQSTLSTLLNTNISSLSVVSLPAAAIVAQNNGINETWPQLGQNGALTGSSVAGPLVPSLGYTFSPNTGAANSMVVAGYGNVYVAYGLNLYALNGTTGSLIWTRNTLTNTVAQPVLYNGAVIFANSTSIVAVNAYTSNLLWSSPPASAVTSPLSVYEGQILFGASNDHLYGLSPANGTQLWTYNVGAVPVVITVANGTMIVKSSAGTAYTLNYFGGTLEQTASVSSISSYSVPSYGSTMAFGYVASGVTKLGIDSLAGGTIVTANSPTEVQGVSEYAGIYLFQANTSVTAYSATAQYNATSGIGQEVWNYTVPSLYGKAYTNATPVEAGGTVYSLWSNGFLLALNASDGAYEWSSNIPYAITRPTMTIAYGRLFVTTGPTLLAYGACPVSNGDSILYSAVYMYLNGKSGCARALLYAVTPQYNYSLFINGSFAAGTAASLNGKSSILIGGNQSTGSDTYSWSFWIFPTNNLATQGLIGQSCTYAGCFFITTNGKIVSYGAYVGSGGAGNSASVSANIVLNAWQHIVVTYQYSSGTGSIYVNGILRQYAILEYGLASYPSVPVFIGNSSISGATANYQGELANIQVYNSTLSQGQVSALYGGGVENPPLLGAQLEGWWPLQSSTNDYGPYTNTGYAIGPLSYVNCNCLPPGLSNAFEVNTASITMPVTGTSTGASKLYNVKVTSWT